MPKKTTADSPDQSPDQTVTSSSDSGQITVGSDTDINLVDQPPTASPPDTDPDTANPSSAAADTPTPPATDAQPTPARHHKWLPAIIATTVIIIMLIVASLGYYQLVLNQNSPYQAKTDQTDDHHMQHQASASATPSPTASPTVSPTPTATPTKTAAIPTFTPPADWQKYTDPVDNFSFYYPPAATIRADHPANGMSYVGVVFMLDGGQESIPVSFTVNRPRGCTGPVDESLLADPYQVTLGQSIRTIYPKCWGDDALAVNSDDKEIDVEINRGSIHQPYWQQAQDILKSVQGLVWK